MKKALAVVAMLAGCAAPMAGNPVPDRARLSDSTLTLVLSDATVCRAEWRAAPVGQFENCGPGFGYAVTEVENPNPLRQIWAGLTKALGAEGAVPPLAKVVITGPAGQKTVFASPPEVAE